MQYFVVQDIKFYCVNIFRLLSRENLSVARRGVLLHINVLALWALCMVYVALIVTRRKGRINVCQILTIT